MTNNYRSHNENDEQGLRFHETSSCKVVLIEDNPADIELVRHFLNESTDFNFTAAFYSTLESGINAVHANVPDVVLLDLNLPGSQGISTLFKFFAAVPPLPVVVLTGAGKNNDLALQILRLGAQEYVPKDGLNTELLVRAIRYSIERFRYECALKRSVERMELALQHANIFLFNQDTELRYLWVFNSAQFFAERDVIGQKDDDLLSPEVAEVVVSAKKEVLESNKKSNLPVTIKIAEQPRHFLFTIEPTHDHFGNCTGLTGAALDVTERMNLEEQLRQSQKMEAVGQLAGGIAHDFNNLLMVITSCANFADEALPQNSPAQADLNEVIAAANRASNLTRQLLAFSRRQILQPELVNLNEVIVDLQKMLKRLIAENIDLQFHSEETLGLIKADRAQLQQVVMNLVINASDAMLQGGKLVLRTANVELQENETKLLFDGTSIEPGPHVLLTLEDNGAGMTPEVKARAFEPFFTTKKWGKGTGLGLSTVFGIVKQHGGCVALHSEQDIGTRVDIYLPAIQNNEREKSSNLNFQPIDTHDATHTTVLVVEDDVYVRNVTGRMLHRMGYRVLDAADAQEAEDLVNAHMDKIDILLTDVVMPYRDGKQLAEKLKQNLPHIKIIYMSGYPDERLSNYGVFENDVEFMHKPFTKRVLAEKIEQVLAS